MKDKAKKIYQILRLAVRRKVTCADTVKLKPKMNQILLLEVRPFIPEGSTQSCRKKYTFTVHRKIHVLRYNTPISIMRSTYSISKFFGLLLLLGRTLFSSCSIMGDNRSRKKIRMLSAVLAFIGTVLKPCSGSKRRRRQHRNNGRREETTPTK